MADRSGGTISIRLAVRDGEVVRNELRRFGAEGERAIKQLDDAAKRAPPSLLALNAGMRELRTTAEGFAQNAGAVGAGLSALGPMGFVAAAGFGAATIGANKLIGSALEVGEQLGDLKDRAEQFGLSVETLQGLQGFGIEAGVSVEQLNSSLEKFTVGVGQAADGQGKLYTALEKTNPTALQAILNSENQEQALRAAAQAIAAVESETGRAALAVSIFGKSGSDLGRVFAEAGGNIDLIVARATDAGLVVGKELVDRGDDFGDKISVAAEQIQTLLTPSLVSAGETMASLAQSAANFATNIAGLKAPDWFKAMWNAPDKLFQFIANTSNEAQQAAFGGTLSDAVAKVAEPAVKAASPDSRISQAFGGLPVGGVPLPKARPADAGILSDENFARVREEGERRVADALRSKTSAERDATAATRDNEEAERDHARLLLQAARTKLELGDYTAALAEQEKRYGAQLRAGVITQDEYTASVARTRKELEDTALRARNSGMSENVRGVTDAFRDGADSLKGALLGSDTWTDALSDGLARVNSRLLDIALNPGLDAIFGGGKTGGGGLLGSAISSVMGAFTGGSAPSGTVPLPMARPAGLAGGGPVYGPGTGTSDSIPARLSNGEYVVRSGRAALYRPLLDAINNGGSHQHPGFAMGGLVGGGGLLGSAISSVMGAFAGGSAPSGTVPPPMARPAGLAGGGPVYGLGTGTSDSIPARLSNGEYVVRAGRAALYRPLLDAINNGGSHRLPGFAMGGPVGGGGASRAYRAEGNQAPSISIGGTSVTVQGNMGATEMAQLKRELDQRDKRLMKNIQDGWRRGH